MVDKIISSKLVESLRKHTTELYGQHVQQSSVYGRIINSKHFQRLKKVLDEQKKLNPNTIVFGGEMDESDLYFGPTFLVNVEKDMEKNPIMQDEIFGPMLPIIEVENVQEAIDYVNSRYFLRISYNDAN